MVLSITAFYIRLYSRSLTFLEILVFFFIGKLLKVFWIASMRDFNGVIVFLSIICPRNFTRVRKNFY